MAGTVKGSCKWFNSKKGFGFIILDGGEEIFVHQSEIYASGFRSLAEGEPIECQVTVDENGKKKAVKVTGPNGGVVQGDNRRMYGGGGGYSNGGGYGNDGNRGYGGGRAY